MKKALSIVLVVMFIGAALAHADSHSSSGSGKSGWQKVYDDISSWSWSKKSD